MFYFFSDTNFLMSLNEVKSAQIFRWLAFAFNLEKVSFKFSLFLAVIITSAPKLLNKIAVARPIPDDAPVITIFFEIYADRT